MEFWIFRFEGTLSYEGKQYALDNDNIVLRGAILRNTLWYFFSFLIRLIFYIVIFFLVNNYLEKHTLAIFQFLISLAFYIFNLKHSFQKNINCWWKTTILRKTDMLIVQNEESTL